MSIISQFSRISHHTVTDGSTFSIPSQEDFTLPFGASGSWTKSDLALSEIGVDELNNKAFIRIGSNINEFSFGGTVSGVTPSLSDVLVVGNTTGGSDIIMSVGDEITSADGSSSILMNNSFILLSADASNSIRISETETLVVGENYVDISSGLGYVGIEGLRFQGYSVSTSDATITDIATYSWVGSNNMKFFEAYITGIQTDGSNGYYGKITSAIRNDGGTLFQVGTIDLIEKTDFSTATSTIDFSGTSVRVRVTGEAGTNINWICKLKWI